MKRQKHDFGFVHDLPPEEEQVWLSDTTDEAVRARSERALVDKRLFAVD